jgi:hypothetical protein
MAADTKAAGGAKASDFSPVKREPGPDITAETRIAPTCMIWSTAIGIGILVLIVLVWALSHIGPTLARLFGNA